MKLVWISNLNADVTNGQAGAGKQRGCFTHSIADQEVLWRLSDHIFENFTKIASIKIASKKVLPVRKI